MKKTYKGLNLNYDYTKYFWIITNKTGEIIASFNNLDDAKAFIDALIPNG